jgi:hypothetical protein
VNGADHSLAVASAPTPAIEPSIRWYGDTPPRPYPPVDQRDDAVNEGGFFKIARSTLACVDQAPPGPPPVYAKGAERGMLLAHNEDGENVGLEITHVELAEDRVLIVLIGAEIRWYRHDDQLPVVDRVAAEAAQERLRLRRRRRRQIEELRRLADLAEKHDLSLPYCLEVTGQLDTLDDLRRLADALGLRVEETRLGSGNYQLDHDEETAPALAPVKVQFTHYAREVGR